MMAKPLLGKVALVTGAARGQGRSHALRLADEGADVVLVDVCRPFATTGYVPAGEADLKDTAEQVRERGATAWEVVADVRDEDALRRAVDGVTAERGRLDILVANAGISSFGAFLDLTGEQWREMLDVNITGTVSTVRATVPAMISAGHGGSIVLIGSTASLRGTAYNAHYVVSKHGVLGLMRALAVELAEHDIRVNAVCPGSVDTPMGLDPSIARLANDPAMSPLLFGTFRPILPSRIADVADITEAVYYLAGPGGRLVTGQALAVDSGVTAW